MSDVSDVSTTTPSIPFPATTGPVPAELPTHEVDVLVIGMGPVGKMAALLLARAGHTVTVVDRRDAAYALPRAVAHDAEIARALQNAGLPPDTMPEAEQPYDDMYVWVNGDDVLLHAVDWTGIDPSGWNNTYFYHQPAVEARLDASLREQPGAHLRRGTAASITGQDAAGVDVRLRPVAPDAADTADAADAADAAVRARFVLAADGAGSATRTGLGIDWTDLGYFFDWLVVDVVPGPGLEVTHLAKQVCDPARPTTVVPAGPGRRRWEFMRLDGESVEELTRPERIWQLLEPFGVRSDTAELERGVVYTFNSGWASRWRQDRVLLLGDAAHQMPPFAGQGLAAGIRDCTNLSWKLDLVLRGLAGDDLLDTYAAERSAHVADFIEFSMSLGRIICITDPAEAADRDAAMAGALADGRAPEPPPTPRLGPGVHTGPAGGCLSWQGRVSTADHPAPARYDDVFGPAALIVADRGLLAAVSVAQRHALAVRGVPVTTFDPAPRHPDGEASGTAVFSDVDGTYARWFTQLGSRAVLVRPDFYVYGAAATPSELSDLVTGFLAALGVAAPAPDGPVTDGGGV